MSHKDLLDEVQPPEGWFVVVGIKGGVVKQVFCEERAEVDEVVASLVKKENDVYFGVAKFATSANRTKNNVLSLQSLWLDIDCGPDKAIFNGKTGLPKGYEDQDTAAAALRDFCKALGLPRPTIVNSGRGLHVYWALRSPVSKEQWEPVAAALKARCLENSLHVDPVIFETARILRVPGTLNFKSDPPLPVRVEYFGEPVDFGAFSALLGIEAPEEEAGEVQSTDMLNLPGHKREMSDLAKQVMDNITSSFSKIMRRSLSGTGCAQLKDCYENRATLSEPRWRSALSIAQFCSDKDEAIHTLSEGHPDYSRLRTIAKAKDIPKPHKCVTIEAHNPGGCEGCPHKGKITNPLALGRILAGTTDQFEEEAGDRGEGEYDGEELEGVIPEPPWPYIWGPSGGLFRLPRPGAEDGPTLIYEHKIYLKKRMTDPSVGDVVIMGLQFPHDGVKEFVVPNSKLHDTAELRKELSARGVFAHKKQFDMILTYITDAGKAVQLRKGTEKMRLQFGWVEKDSKFIIGDREISAEGSRFSPPSVITAPLAEKMQPVGKYDMWREVFALYGRAGLERHAFAALTAFGAPLFKFTGQHGSIINLIHPNSGTGKTTILRMCNSVYGSPDGLCVVNDDTFNAKVMRLGLMCHLPYTIDELTNMNPKDFSTLAYNMTQGRGKDRVKQSSNELRYNATTWSTISLCSSNASFMEKIAATKTNADGEVMRLIEYKISFSDAIDASTGKDMFDHTLMENYGHAGDIYMAFVVANLEECRRTLAFVQQKLDTELRLTQRERFWSGTVAANIAGGLIAKQLGIHEFNMKSVYKEAKEIILGMRTDTPLLQPSVASTDVLANFINRHIQNVLVVNDSVDLRSNMPTIPVREPKGELIIRYEPDTKLLYVLSRAFKNDCVETQINYKETLEQLHMKGIFLRTEVKRMAKGTKIASPGAQCLVFDAGAGAFLDMTDVPAADAAD